MVSWLELERAGLGEWRKWIDRADRPDPIDGTVARALAVAIPYEYTQVFTYHDPDSEPFFDDAYTDGRGIVDGRVSSKRQIKLLVEGFLWSETGGDDQWFKLQLRRPGPPMDIDSFGTYNFWYRHQPGVVEDARTPEFEPAGEKCVERGQLEFEEVPLALKHHVVQLELVRNPPLAAYVLKEREQWDEYGEAFRWDPDAFE